MKTTQDYRAEANLAREQIAEARDKMETILDRAKREDRDLRPDEEGRFDELEAKVKKLGRDADYADRRAEETNGSFRRQIDDRGGQRPDPQPALLGREDRMLDRVTNREGEELRLGALVRGMVTGEWDGADEERALAEG